MIISLTFYFGKYTVRMVRVFGFVSNKHVMHLCFSNFKI